MKKIGLFLATLLFGMTASAYITATIGPVKPTDPNKRTHIFIIGNGSELGSTLEFVAAAKARKYIELYPDEQIHVISVNNFDEDKYNVEALTKKGFKDITIKSSSFSSADVFNEMKRFNQIATVDIVSHTAAFYGVILDGKYKRLDPKKDGYDRLRGNFTSDAYVFLHGCNSGWLLGQVFSKQWGVPVAASFTGTDLQYVYENQKFENHDRRAPVGFKKATVNKISFNKNMGCYQGVCIRLFPDNFGYNGHWGSFNEGGLGFFKWFCETNTPDHCMKTMAKAALSYVSVKSLNMNSSLEDYKEVVFDYLCPSTKRELCRAEIEKSMANGGTPVDLYNGKSLECSFTGCQAKFQCERIPFIDLLKEKSCTVTNLRTTSKTSTLINEYKAYIRGYELLMAKK